MRGGTVYVRTCIYLIFVTRLAEAQARSQYSVIVSCQPVLQQNYRCSAYYFYKMTRDSASREFKLAALLYLQKILLVSFRILTFYSGTWLHESDWIVRKVRLHLHYKFVLNSIKAFEKILFLVLYYNKKKFKRNIKNSLLKQISSLNETTLSIIYLRNLEL